MPEFVDINSSVYSYAQQQDISLEELSLRVTNMRKSGALTGEALLKIRKFFRIKNIYHSNAIEGNTLDVGETRQVVEHGLTITGKPLKDQAEAKNLSEALDFLEDLAKNREIPITENDIRQIHFLILKGIDDTNAGKYRTVQVAIGGSRYTPPAPESIPAEMQNFGKWLATKTVSGTDFGDKEVVLIAAVAHTWFVTIHPFIDGNGRVARLLLNLILMRAGFPIAIIAKEDRLRYYDALEESQASDLTAFVSLVTECIDDSLEEYERAVAEQREMEEWAYFWASKLSRQDEVKARNEFEVWRNAMELLKSYFRQATILLDESVNIGQVLFKDFGSLEYEKYLSLRRGKGAKKTWFFRIDFKSEKRTVRYLFFFGSPSYSLKNECDVTIHLAREETEGSLRYDRLESIQMPNVPDIYELGYKPDSEQFVVKGPRNLPRPEKLESVVRRFFEQVIDKHFSS
jgi:Fic family protein